MKKVRMLTSMAGANFSYEYGKELELEDAIADRWVNAGIAEPVSAASATGAGQTVTETATARPARKPRG